MLELPFPYEANEVQIEAMMQDVMSKTDMPVILAENLGGRVSVSNPDGTLRDLLDEMARDGKAAWWFDGRAIHIEGAGSMVSRLIPLNGFSIGELRDQLAETGLASDRYPLRGGADAEMARLVAPQGYADAVAELAAHMTATREETAPAEKRLPTVIRGRGRVRQ
ncbi:hypothetical protein [Paracoccus sediminicola]|uniref:hypothetical protein n=1 Tax=Paracoccus sediminicola TaxID=3017783 RepID=UPI0022F11EAA|nr:hypothetical protein [Paracoccus sediminicola]WBU57175.1 hypothetical protein PAF18_01640 [Paracoccus sediminicola]